MLSRVGPICSRLRCRNAFGVTIRPRPKQKPRSTSIRSRHLAGQASYLLELNEVSACANPLHLDPVIGFDGALYRA